MLAPSEITAPPCVGAHGRSSGAVTPASVADRARLCGRDEAIDVLLEEEAALRQRFGGGADLLDVVLVRRVALLDRQPRVAAPGAVGGGLRERDRPTQGVAQVGSVEPGG